MGRMRFVLIGLILLGSASLLRADGIPIDPLMDVTDPPCFEGMVCPNPIGPNQGFRFTTVPNGNGDGKAGGVFEATNFSGVAWTSLLFEFNNFSLQTFGPLSCTINGTGGTRTPFDFCSIFRGEFTTTIDYTCDTRACVGGIPVGDIFRITLNDIPALTGSWPQGLVITGFPNGNRNPSGGFVTLTPTPVPEPATLTLLGIGLTAMVAKRKYRGRRDSAN